MPASACIFDIFFFLFFETTHSISTLTFNYRIADWPYPYVKPEGVGWPWLLQALQTEGVVDGHGLLLQAPDSQQQTAGEEDLIIASRAIRTALGGGRPPAHAPNTVRAKRHLGPARGPRAVALTLVPPHGLRDGRR